MPGTSNQSAIRALANPVRRRILELLREGELSVNALAEHFDIARPAISRHLRTLREAGLVIYRSEHRTRYYAANAGEIDRFRREFDAEFSEFWRPQHSTEQSDADTFIAQSVVRAHEVRIATSLPISPKRAYRFCTEEKLFKSWVGEDARSDPRPGGEIAATSAFGGKLVAQFLALDPGRMLLLRVLEPLDPDANLYTISLTPDGSGGCVAELRHFVRDEQLARLVSFAWSETWKLLREAALADAARG